MLCVLKSSDLVCLYKNSNAIPLFRNHKVVGVVNCSKENISAAQSREKLKYSCNIISPALSHIFNLSVILGVYPSKLKISKITPIYKSEDETDPSNYRPISLLSNFNRIFEKLLYYRMKEFIDKNNLLCSSQYGFRKSHSTEHAVLDIVEDILRNMDKRYFSCGVFIDLKKVLR